VQVAGHGAGGADDDVAGADGVVDGGDDLDLGGQRDVGELVGAFYCRGPL